MICRGHWNCDLKAFISYEENNRGFVIYKQLEDSVNALRMKTLNQQNSLLCEL